MVLVRAAALVAVRVGAGAGAGVGAAVAPVAGALVTDAGSTGGKTQDRMARRQSRHASASGTVASGPSGLTAGVGRITRRDSHTIADIGTKSGKLAVMNLVVTTIVELVGAALFFVVVG